MPGRVWTSADFRRLRILGSSTSTASWETLAICAALLLSTGPAPAQFAQQGPKLVGSGSVGTANQGRSVARCADGNTGIVGGGSVNGGAGAAWVFTRSGGAWMQQGPKLFGSGTVGTAPAMQGTSVALSADGNTAIVGGVGDNGFIGAAWVFTRSGGVWTQEGPKLVGGGVGGGFANQGASVALSGDGNTAIVGGNNDNGFVGAAWVFTRSGGVWTQQGPKLVGTGGVGSFIFQGDSVALSDDGNTAMVGGSADSSNRGAAWVFTRSGGVWTQQGAKLIGSGAVGGAQQGLSVALSDDGNTAVLGGPGDNGGIGATWAFTRNGGVWTQQGAKLIGSGAAGAAAQGFAVALSGDGNAAIVGGRNDNINLGAAWVVTRSGGVWTQQGAKLVGSAAAGAVAQALSAALSADGNTAIVGGNADNANVGAAWVFVQTPPPPPPPPPPPATCTLASQFGDFNGDGRDDLLFRRDSDGLLSQYLMNGLQIASAQLLGAVGTDWTLAAVADFNGDRGADLLFRRASDGMLSLYLGNGGQIVASQFIGAVGTDWELVGAADVNGDGRADLLFRRVSDGMLSLYLLNGFDIQGSQLIGAVGLDWRIRAVRDFNGDGRADMLFRRVSDGMLSLYLMNGFDIQGSQLMGAIGLEWDLLGARDFDGDGRADLLARRPSDGMLALYLLNGFQIQASQLIGAIGLEWSPLGLGDLNGDGRSDMIFRRASDGMLSGYLMNGFQMIDAQLLGAIGTDFGACYGQPPLARVSGR